MDMNVGGIKPPEMPSEFNVGKAGQSQPAFKAQLPAVANEVTLSDDQMAAISNLKPTTEDAIAILSSLQGNINVAPKVAAQINSILH